MKDKMEKDRLKRWINSSLCVIPIEGTLIWDVQGLGRLDVELIKETDRIKTKSKIPKKTKSKHITLSKLWILGAYELVRIMDEIVTQRNVLIPKESISKVKGKIKEAKIELEKIRIPLTKFQVPNREKLEKNELFAQFPEPFIDSSGEVSWKVYTVIQHRPTEIYYRKDFGDLLLKLFESISEDIRAK